MTSARKARKRGKKTSLGITVSARYSMIYIAKGYIVVLRQKTAAWIGLASVKFGKKNIQMHLFQAPGGRYTHSPAVSAPEGNIQDAAAVLPFFGHTPHSCGEKRHARCGLGTQASSAAV